MKYSELESKADTALRAMQELELAMMQHDGEWSEYGNGILDAVSMLGRISDAMHYAQQSEDVDDAGLNQ